MDGTNEGTDPAARPVGDGAVRGRDLLVVENDERLGQLLEGFLTRRGHRVRRATSFAAARPLLAEAPPELLLSDLELGDEDARDILPVLAAEGLLPPTLVVSGYLDLSVRTELEAIPGVVGFVPKPFEFDQLLAAIEAAREPA
jgi:DNA-binding NtrC family response regulator